MKSFLQTVGKPLTEKFLLSTTWQPGLLFFCLFIFNSLQVQAQNNMGIGTPNPDGSAVLDIVSPNKGVLVPRMLDSDRALIQNPATGLIVYQTNGTAGFYYNAGTPGFTGVLSPGATTGMVTISAVIMGGSILEARVNNNTDADKLDYFQQ